MAKGHSAQMLALQAGQWNRNNPVGADVVVQLPGGQRHYGRTVSEAQVRYGTELVIGVAGLPDLVPLDRVKPATESRKPT